MKPVILRKTVAATFLARVKETPFKVGFKYRNSPSEPAKAWQGVEYDDFYQEVQLLAFGLVDLGVSNQDRVAIISESRIEWVLADMATLGVRAISVPVYSSYVPEDIAYILEHSGARVAFVENAAQLRKLFEVGEKSLVGVQKFIVFDGAGLVTVVSELEKFYSGTIRRVMTLAALREIGERRQKESPHFVEQNFLVVEESDVFTICYTSGTTGTPKGVVLSHRNMMASIEGCSTVLREHLVPEEEVVLTFLPFSHIFGRFELLCSFVYGWELVFPESLQKFMSNLEEVRPTVLVAVPRFFEKAYNRVHSRLEVLPSLKKLALQKAISLARQSFSTSESKSAPRITEKLAYSVAKKTVLDPLLGELGARFGGNLKFAICGGAPLAVEIGEFFWQTGLPVLEGYGLTETAGPVSLSLPKSHRAGWVGKALPGVALQIAEDGEVLVQSPSVSTGYYRQEEEKLDPDGENGSVTAETGWLQTGDIGRIDPEGFLQITDRKKDILITSSGRSCSPQKIEKRARSLPWIRQFVVVGDGRAFLSAMITLDREQVIRHAHEGHIFFSEWAELIKNSRILSVVQKTVDELNQRLAHFEQIRKFIILPEDFTVDSGELSPSLKVRRKFVEQKYHAQIGALYLDSAS